MKKFLLLFCCLFCFAQAAFAQDGGLYYCQKQNYIGDRPISMYIVLLSPNSDYDLKLTFGNGDINDKKKVVDFAKEAGANVAMNASYFKQDKGTPIGVSIVDGKLITGPLMNRIVFGIDKRGNCYIDRVSLDGEIWLGAQNSSTLIKTINQPIVSSDGAYLYNYHWGSQTPNTAEDYYWHVAVLKNKIVEVSSNSVSIPDRGYAVVVKKSLVERPFTCGDLVKYYYKLSPKEWCKFEYAFAGGPNLVTNGEKDVDFQSQNFDPFFARVKTARSAIGIKSDGTVILLAVDGKQKGVSEGASLFDMADLMIDLGAQQAMNLDGGSSTQIAIDGQMMNVPTNKYGAKVTNAVVITRKNQKFLFKN
ncbi:MAG: phosphodiester glycosidase family protein [Candidatus Gastranaerophilales bacterium]|nr:phosphodiester glycosidase family protein [Candidatus Gastranaerophilales bacterium]